MIHPSIYKEKNKETGKETRTISLRERWQDAYECAVDGSAQLHVLAEMFRELFGREPNLPRIGVLRKQARSGFALMAIMLEAAKERIGDDPHDYLQKMLQRRNERPPERDRFVPQAEINSGRHKRLVL